MSAAAKSERLLNLLIMLLVQRHYIAKDRIRSILYPDSTLDAFEKMFERDKDELRSLGVPVEVATIDPFFEDDVGMSAAEELFEELLEMAANCFDAFRQQPPAVGVDPLNDLLECPFGPREILELRRQRFVALFELAQFFEGGQIHAADRGDLAAEIGNFLVHLVALVQLVGRGMMLEVGQFDAVIFAQTSGQRIALEADLASRQSFGVQIVFELSQGCANVLGIVEQRGSLGTQFLAAADCLAGGTNLFFFAEVEQGEL